MAKKAAKNKTSRSRRKPAEPVVQEPVEQEPEVETFPPTEEPEAKDEVQISDLTYDLDDNQCVVQLACGDHTRLSTYENKHIADAAEEATAAYVVSIGKFPDPAEPVIVTVATNKASFGPFVVACSLVVEAKELRG